MYDCSFQPSEKQPSLNDCLITGPSFLHDLSSILVRFRSYPYGISTDIEKAFLHVKLDEKDREESPLQIYRFKTVLFGAACSPFMLNAVLKFHLSKFDTPVSKDMQQNLYVDNILSGGDTEDEVVKYYKESRDIMSKAKFNLRAWATNSHQLHHLAVKESAADDNVNVGTLGMIWTTTADTLSLAIKDLLKDSHPPITKREVLQKSSKIFDPLGLLAPVTIQSKLLLQDMWQKRVQWNEPLHEELQNQWICLAEDIHKAASLSIPRYYSISPSSCSSEI